MRNYLILIAIVAFYACQPSKKNYSWDEFAVEGEPSFRGISVLNEKIIFVSGTKGTVLKTINGGLDWEEVYVPDADSLDFRDVEVLNENEIILMSAGSGKLSNIYKSHDGGKHWEVTFTNQDSLGFFDGMAFWDDTHGVLGGDPVDSKLFLMTTSDGGNTWQRIHPDNLPEMNENEYGGFAASGSHLAVKGNSIWLGTGGLTARIFYSKDRGQHWEVVYTPMVQGEGSQGIFSIDLYDENTGVAVGGNYKKEDEGLENVILSKDGSETWSLSNDFPVFQSSVRYVSQDELISVGPSACYQSLDGGLTWKAFGESGFHTMDRAEDGSIWAAGSDGRIAQLIVK